MTLESEPVRENDSTPDARRETDVKSSHANPDILPASSVPQLPPTETHCQITCKPEKDWWDKSKPFVEIVGIILLGVYTVYTIKISRANKKAAEAAHDTLVEIQKQTILSRQQLVGTQGALLELHLDVNPDGETFAELLNIGHVTATNIHFRLEVTRQNLPSETPIGTPIVFEWPIPPIKADPASYWAKNWPLPWIPKRLTERQEWPKGWPGKETLMIRGRFSYQNGFGDGKTEEFCRQWLPGYTIVTKTGSPNGAGGGLIPCENFRALIRAILEKERQAEKEK